MATIRLESDSIGTLEVPADAYYGVQSLRGSMNFRITGYRIHDKQIKMLAALKKASAYANHRAGILDRKISANRLPRAVSILRFGWVSTPLNLAITCSYFLSVASL